MFSMLSGLLITVVFFISAFLLQMVLWVFNNAITQSPYGLYYWLVAIFVYLLLMGYRRAERQRNFDSWPWLN